MEYTVSTVMEKEFSLGTQEAIRYLNLYVGETDWKSHLNTLYKRLKQVNGEQQAAVLMRKTIAFAVMLPTYDRSKVTDPPENLLFGGHKYAQFGERDWVDLLSKEIEKDKQIEECRNQCLSLGIIYPIEYSPVTRQAFNWLFSKAEETGVITASNKKEMIKKFQNLVVAYGGAIICSIFTKEEWKLNKKVLNWRSNYFFEKLIYDVYTPEQIFKIKKQELSKTNPRLVKTVRTD